MSGDGLRVTILGCGTVVPDHVRFPSTYLVEAPGVRMLLDCGSGGVSRFPTFGVDWRDLTHLLLTHFHDDHVGGLAGLYVAWKHGMIPPREAPLTVIGPPGTRATLERLDATPGAPDGSEVFAQELVEMEPGEEQWVGPLCITCHPTPHTPESVAYRIQGPDGTLGTTGDTGPSDEVADFLAGCDVLLAECSWTDPLPVDIHLSPASLAALAVRARPGLLVVTHVFPTHLTPDDAVTGVAREGWAGRTVAAHDGMVIDVRSGGTSALDRIAPSA